jgi:hypothetical protein
MTCMNLYCIPKALNYIMSMRVAANIAQRHTVTDLTLIENNCLAQMVYCHWRPNSMVPLFAKSNNQVMSFARLKLKSSLGLDSRRRLVL